jgi:short-subunit dehydrogenase
MKLIVITGSTRGIGNGLAKEFLKIGCKVVITGRKSADVEKTVKELAAISGSDNVSGIACDVSDPQQVQALWDNAKKVTGSVDIWINNAGLGQIQQSAWEVGSETVQTIMSTNIEGTILGSKVAMQGMLQQGFGAIYNMEGLGSDGRHIEGMSIYGTSKAAVRYYSRALVLEARKTPVIVGTLQPGMVLTDMMTGENVQNPEEWKRLKTLYNFLADTVPNVTRWMSKQILINKTNGRHIKYLTTVRMLQHSFNYIFCGRDVIKEAEEGK